MSLMSVSSFAQEIELGDERAFEDGFWLRVPKDWVEIPREVLDEHSRNMAKAMPNVPPQAFVAGFQHSEGRAWFTPPMMLVYIYEGGRIPEETLRDMRQFNRGFQAGARSTFDSTVPENMTGEFGEAQYDKENGLLISVSEMQVAGGPAVTELLVMKLTNSGAIVFVLGALREDFERWRPVFEAIACSTRVDPALDYNNVQAAPRRGPSVTDTFEYRFGYVMGMVAAILLLLAALVAVVKLLTRISRRRSSDSPPGLPPPPPGS